MTGLVIRRATPTDAVEQDDDWVVWVAEMDAHLDAHTRKAAPFVC